MILKEHMSASVNGERKAGHISRVKHIVQKQFWDKYLEKK